MTGPGERGVREYLHAMRVGRHEDVRGEGLSPKLALLRRWQAERLARTYADLVDHPRFGPACRFFLSDVYAPRDFSQRDHDVARVYASMRGVLPPHLLRVIELALELEELTLALDERLLGVLERELGLGDELTVEMYAEGYRRCDNRPERERQIELLGTLGRAVESLVRKPAVGMALRLASVPARVAGWGELQDFLERGYAAFKHMRGAEQFLATITVRERALLDRIFSGAPDPLGPDAPAR